MNLQTYPGEELVGQPPATSEHVLGNLELPINKQREEIETAIREKSVTILVAPTGSGKTTQVPQFALEMLNAGGEPEFEEIIVTQPRIIAARTVSERVANEIAGAGQTAAVGYYTSKERSVAPQQEQNIAFLTDGKAMVQMLHEGQRGNSGKKKLLIIDEVHEWGIEVEQLIAMATEKTDPSSEQYDPNLKVVIMSATLDSKRMQEHFAHVKPPLIEISVATHEITDSTDPRYVARVALEIAAETGGKVLAFFPGVREINKAALDIWTRQSGVRPEDRIPVIPLHGQQTKAEQSRAFEDYPHGVVFASTNVTQTSVTVPGIVAVVDGGQVRIDQVTYNILDSGSEGLYLVDASQADVWQRRGRAGRTEPGQHVMASPDGKRPPVPFESRPEYAVPAMQRSRLDSLLLHVKATGFELEDFRHVHKPPEKAVEAAQNRLFILGAIDKAGNITKRGQRMEKLPLDPEYSCMVEFAHEKGYRDDVIDRVLDIAAIMQLGGVLKRSPKEQNWRRLIKKGPDGETKETESDFFAQLEAYVELINNVERDRWGLYDVNEHAAGLVEQGRASLAHALGRPEHLLANVAPENRKEVLTCINAGQLNQLWHRRGDSNKWNLVMGGSGWEREQSRASVVSDVGRLATGKVFTLGLGHKEIISVQDLNGVLGLRQLEAAASHLVTDVVDPNTTKFDPDRQEMVAMVQRKLGGLVLRSFQQVVEPKPGTPEESLANEGYREQAWQELHERDKGDELIVYDLGTVGEAIENPARTQYGIDPETGEPLYAWMGGKGRWCKTREIAIDSLVSLKNRLERAPLEQERRAIKDEVRRARSNLIAIKNGREGQTAAAARELLSRQKKLPREEFLTGAWRLTEQLQEQSTT